MKNIEDVIKAYECKKSIEDKCNECPYITECDDKYHCECEARDNDTLHYLKAFRDAKNALDAEREKTIEAYCQWKDAIEKLEAQTSQMMWVDKHFQVEISDNPALTWDELRTMEGKPVWVESSDSFNRRRWMFVGEWFDDDEMRLFDMGYDYPDYVSKNGYESGTWQAYRKERE